MGLYLMWLNLQATFILLFQCLYELFDYMISNMIHVSSTLKGERWSQTKLNTSL